MTARVASNPDAASIHDADTGEGFGTGNPFPVTSTPATVGAGTAAAAARVTLASDDPGVTALQAMDDWDESDRAKVNLIVGQAGVAAGTGVSGATVQRVVDADDGGPTTTARLLSAAASTNATSVKGSAGVLYSVRCFVVRASACYLKLYDKATAPNVGTDTPVMTLILPAGAIPVEREWSKGRYFSTGIAYAITTAVADADTGALTAGDVVALNLDYR